MARPKKSGLDYFPFDIDFFQDEKVVCVAGEFGLKGEICMIHLLCAIYRNGYFIVWNDMLKYKLLKELPGISAGLLQQIVEGLVRWGFFDEDLFGSAQILTSRGIQKRYFEAIRRRVPSDSKLPYLLVSADINKVSADINPINDNINPQSKVKKNKENISPHNPPLGEKRAAARCGMDFLKDLLSSITSEAFERQLKAMDLSRDRFEEVALMVLSDWEDFNEPQRNARHLFNHVRRKIAADPSLKSLPKRQAKAQYRAERAQERRQRDAEAEEIRSSGKTSWQLYCERNGLDPDKTSAADLAAAKSNESKSTE